MTNTRAAWTDSRLIRAQKMWTQGVTASQIAEALGGGLTKNAVLGMAHREKWPRDPAISAHNKGLKRIPEPVKRTKAPEWPAEHLARLIALVALGRSGSEIARELNAEFPGANYTRDAVNTKRGRLGLKVDPLTVAINSKRLQPPRPEAPEVRSVTPVPLRVHPVTPNAKIMADLNAHECRWSVGPDPGRGRAADQLFCAEATDEGQRYCPEHRKLAYTRERTPAEKAADERRMAAARAGKLGSPNINQKLFGGPGRAA